MATKHVLVTLNHHLTQWCGLVAIKPLSSHHPMALNPQFLQDVGW